MTDMKSSRPGDRTKHIMAVLIQGMALLMLFGETARGQSEFKPKTIDCVLTVTSPWSGDVWEEGATYTIEWQKTGVACEPFARVELYKSGTLYRQISTTIEDKGTFTWTIPAELGEGDDFSIVVWQPTYPNYVWGESAPFTIQSSYPRTSGLIVIPAAAKINGANGTHWVTDLVLHNQEDFNVFAILFFCESGKDNMNAQGATVLVPAKQSIKLHDVVGNLFGKSDAFGFIEVQMHWIGQDLYFLLETASRTYNDQGGKGTFGQEVPGISYSKAMRYGWEVYLINLTQTDQFRTNIGFINNVRIPITISYKLFKGDGAFVGEGSVNLPPFGHTQINELIRQFTSEPLDGAFLEITSDTDQAYYFAYASTVDNRTGDPSFNLLSQ